VYWYLVIAVVIVVVVLSVILKIRTKPDINKSQDGTDNKEVGR
jgi:hypothetical protein